MLIPCPWCGERTHTEFAYGGDATVRRPARPDEASNSDWYAYLYLRKIRAALIGSFGFTNSAASSGWRLSGIRSRTR